MSFTSRRASSFSLKSTPAASADMTTEDYSRTLGISPMPAPILLRLVPGKFGRRNDVLCVLSPAASLEVVYLQGDVQDLEDAMLQGSYAELAPFCLERVAARLFRGVRAASVDKHREHQRIGRASSLLDQCIERDGFVQVGAAAAFLCRCGGDSCRTARRHAGRDRQ